MYCPDGIGSDPYRRKIQFEELPGTIKYKLFFLGVNSWESLKYRISTTALLNMLSDKEFDIISQYLKMNGIKLYKNSFSLWFFTFWRKN